MGTPTFVILIVCFATLAVADDFRTTKGKEYKNATVSRVEPDGITVKFSGGLVKIPFTELSRELQEKYHYDPDKAAAAQAAEMAAIQETNQLVKESNKLLKDAEQQKELENRLFQLQQQEEMLVEQMRRVGVAAAAQQADAEANFHRRGAEESMTSDEKTAQYAWRLNRYNGLKQAAARQGTNAIDIVPPKWGEADWDPLSRVRGGSSENGEQVTASEADLPRLKSQLDSVRKEKQNVEQELARKAAASGRSRC